jgi:hypothetical protein
VPPCFAHESSSRGDSVQPAAASLKGDRNFVLAAVEEYHYNPYRSQLSSHSERYGL